MQVEHVNCVQAGGDKGSGSCRGPVSRSDSGGEAGDEYAAGGEGGVRGDPDGGHREGANKDWR